MGGTKMSFYKLEHLEQGSRQWHDWRKTVIGASDAPVIMGENPWGSKNNLMNEKLGLKAEFSGNAATREGNLLEGEARSIIQKKTGLKLGPTIVQHNEIPFLAASLDAISLDDKQIFEIKCGQKTYEHVKQTSEVPKYYYGQLQHMLMITGVEEIGFVVYRPSLELLYLKVRAESSYIERMKNAELEFAEQLTRKGHVMQAFFHGSLITS
jgi:putative phage-type endonuclease